MTSAVVTAQAATHAIYAFAGLTDTEETKAHLTHRYFGTKIKCVMPLWIKINR